MTVENYTVEYSVDATTWTLLTNVQNISGFVGRQKLQDTFEPSRMTVSMRYPTGYSSPITALVVGTYIKIRRIGATYEMWTGKIRDVSVSYGIKYTGGVGVSDVATISCEGALAEWGRLQGNDTVIYQDTVNNQLSAIYTATGLGFGSNFFSWNSPTLATSTVDGSYLQWLNTFANSTGAYITDGAGELEIFNKDTYNTLSVAFSDTTNNSTNQVFDDIIFDSISADYFTQVEVNTNTVGTVTAQVGASPYRTLRISTFSVSTLQAADVANYWLNIYNPVSFGISSISCRAEAQNSMNLELGKSWWELPGYKTTVSFRGSTYYLTILGCSLDATPNGARYTYHVCASDMTPYLILDNAIYGILDTNKLSW